MGDISKRLKNAYETGGLSEIGRKAFSLAYYHSKWERIIKENEQSPFEYGLNTIHKRKKKVIVSLTTYPARFEVISSCLKSLTLQSTKPDKIIVYLGSDSVGIELPKSMKRFEEYGIEFHIDKDKNLRSHKKYYYALQEFPDDIVVTADDDVIYPQDWLKSLLISYKKNPTAISARRVHLMRRSTEGSLLPYNHWYDQYRKLLTPSMALIGTGNSGILYPPHSLDKNVFDIEASQRLCFAADDIWLKCMATLKGTPYVWVKNNVVDLPDIKGTSQDTLSNTNVFESKNDILLRNVMREYHITTKMFFE